MNERTRIAPVCGALSFLALAALPSAFVSCKTQDQFECGVATLNSSSTATRCDRAGEVCICATRRCARPNAACNESGWEYVFRNDAGRDDPECVEVPDVATRLTTGPSATGSAGFCPGEGTRGLPCGKIEGGNCLENEICVCGESQCAHRDAACAAETGTEYRYSASRLCVPEVDLTKERLLFPPFSAQTVNQCPGGVAQPCGVAIPGGTAPKCDGTDTCVCAGELYECAFRDLTCDSTYRTTVDGKCVDLPESAITDPASRAGDDGLCPSQRVPTTCGQPVQGGNPEQCSGMDICVCAGEIYRCAYRDNGCEGKYRISGVDGECVAQSEAEILDEANQTNDEGLCPVFEPPDAATEGEL